MKAFDEKHIKNVVLIGSAKSGKTTLSETMLYEAGIINRRGSVEEKNTVSDYHEIEKERGSSVYATTMHTEWRDYKINIIDTPGLDDFVAEVISSVRVADTAVILLNAQNGLEVGLELLWDYVDRYQKPTILAINQLDADKSNFQQTVDEARQFFGSAVTLMQYPLNPGSGFNCIIDLLKMKMYKFSADGGKPEKLPIPEDELDRANELHNELVEKAAENDEDLMEKYFQKGNLDEDEMREGIKIGMMNHDVFPVFCLSGRKNMGAGRMMGFIDNVAPSACEMPPEMTEDAREVDCDQAKPPKLFIYKTLVEPHLGRLSYFKVLSGQVEIGMELFNEKTSATERITQLFITDGKNRTNVERLKAGDIGCTLKLKNSFSNHTLNGKGAKGNVEPMIFPPPKLRVSVVAKNKQDDEKLGEVLNELQIEDPSILIEYNRELKQIIIHAQGELHLAVIKWKLEHIYKMQIEFKTAKVPYRETIQKPALSSYRHKKQSGGAGQFAEVYLKIEPFYEGLEQTKEFNVRDTEIVDLPWGGKLVFNNCIVGGVIDSRFIPAILKGIMEKMNEGPLTGSYVRDVRVSVYDGKMHPVDSNDISFKIAGMMAFKEAFYQAEPLLLEPFNEVEVSMPDEMMGDVITELQSHRGLIVNMENEEGKQVIKSRVPLAELDGFFSSIRNVSQGKAKAKSKFYDYSPVPSELQKKLTEQYHKSEMAEMH